MRPIALLLISLILVAIIAQLLTRPVREYARQAKSISNLQFDNLRTGRSSRVREINELSEAFNAMINGLEYFVRYVPKSLVADLMKKGRKSTKSEERELSVMFTDITDFTSICEGMTANQVARFLNEHISIVSDCIERHQGTVDKFIGDSVMAFWGAPNEMDNPAEEAVKAAIEIRDINNENNQKRISRGQVPVQMRIGIHTGSLVVGDIGSRNRINYTVVGDVANAAKRLQGLGKEIAPKAECAILLSGETVELLSQQIQTVSKGRYMVQGKTKPLEVYHLTTTDL